MYLYPEKPQLIQKEQSLFSRLSNHPDWMAELKYNGSRLVLIHDEKGNFQFWNRHGQRMVYRPTDEIMDILKTTDIPKNTIFDGELRHNKVKGIYNRIVFYDVYVLDGERLRTKYFERRKILDSMFPIATGNEAIAVTKRHQNNFLKLFESVIVEEEIEGLVLKNQKGRLNLSMTSNQTSKWMYKVRKATGRHRF